MPECASVCWLEPNMGDAKGWCYEQVQSGGRCAAVSLEQGAAGWDCCRGGVRRTTAKRNRAGWHAAAAACIAGLVCGEPAMSHWQLGGLGGAAGALLFASLLNRQRQPPPAALVGATCRATIALPQSHPQLHREAISLHAINIHLQPAMQDLLSRLRYARRVVPPRDAAAAPPPGWPPTR